eukprot:NODE_474_length_8025_cov_0.281983.p3 type:complete len:247 gc:universal NODE_474_length_8025_cov_0.281983:1450-2190(+)
MPTFIVSTLIVSAILILGLVGLASTIGTTNYSVPEDCTCDCFDRKFKGVYFREHKQYKSIYFNMEPFTAYIVAWTLFYVILLFKYVEKALYSFMNGKLNWWVVLLGSIGHFSHFYNWWAVFNYLNDRFYIYIYSQVFFSATELIPATCLYILLNNSSPSTNLMNISISVLLMHLWQCMADQGLRHLLLGEEFEFHTFLRDLNFILADGFPLFVIAFHKKSWTVNDVFVILNFSLIFKILFNVGFYD